MNSLFFYFVGCCFSGFVAFVIAFKHIVFGQTNDVDRLFIGCVSVLLVACSWVGMVVGALYLSFVDDDW